MTQESALQPVGAHVLAKADIDKVDPTLVNPILPGTESHESLTGADLFKDLLPAEVQVAVALFKSRISDMVERTSKSVKMKNQEIKQALQGANLPAAIEAGGGEYVSRWFLSCIVPCDYVP